MVEMIKTKEQQNTRHTVRSECSYGPLVIDVWDARNPSGASPVLLVHGWGGTGSYWERTADYLSETVQVIVPDLPGTGRSQPVKRAMNMFDQVNVLADVLDLLELDRVQVNGHSMGGGMTLLLTDKRPERIERILLTCLSFFKTKGQERIYSVVMQGFRLMMGFRPGWLADVPGMTQMMAQRYFYHVPDDPEVLRQGLVDYLQLDAKTAMACARNAADNAIPDAGQNINVPVLLIASRQDRMMPPENVTFTADLIPNCDVYWFEKCGHLPMVERPDEYMRVITDFLDL